MKELERREVASIHTAGGLLSILGDCVVFELGVDKFVADIDLGSDSYVAIGSHSSWGYLIGLAGSDVAIFSENGMTISRKALTRIDFSGKVDPGGIHRIDGVLARGDREVVVTEFSLALLSASGLCWSAEHFDLTARLSTLDANEVWLQGEIEQHGFDLTTGASLDFRGGRSVER